MEHEGMSRLEVELVHKTNRAYDSIVKQHPELEDVEYITLLTENNPSYEPLKDLAFAINPLVIKYSNRIQSLANEINMSGQDNKLKVLLPLLTALTKDMPPRNKS